jgi:elongation factor Ts
MTISMQQVKELRDRTQAGLNDCKSALTEADGDMEKAVELILKKGLAKSAKRAGAIATEGVVAARVAADRKSAVLVEVNIQTDFAARNPDFLAFVEKAVEAAAGAKDGALLGDIVVGSETVEAQRAALVGKLGENVNVRRWTRVSVPQGLVHSYIHMGGKIGAVVGLSLDAAAASKPEVKEFADNVAMQIAAMSPAYLTPAEVPADDKQKQAEIFDTQLREEGKPDAVRPKIVEGKIQKWMKEVCLLEQASILDSEKTVAQKLAELGKAVGGQVALTGFARYECGEGIEKKKDDFAAEAQRMASQEADPPR